MFLPNWHKRIKLSNSNRGLRGRKNVTRRLESLEPRTLLSVTPAAVTITPTEVMDFSTTVATFTADDSGPFMATIDWGDGSTAAVGTVAPAAGGGYDVNGNYAYNEDGPYSLKVTIVDENNTVTPTTATVESTALVAEATTGEGPFAATATAVSTSESTTATAVTALFNDFETNDPSQFRATIDWGDGTSSAGTISAATVILGDQFYNFQVSGSHAYTDEVTGNYTVTISEPEANFSTTVSNSVTVADNDALAGSPATVAATEGQTFTGAVGTFSDSYTGQVASDLAASIDWGDGTVTAGTVTGSGGSFTVIGQHAYAEEGVQTATVAVMDDAPGTASATTAATIDIADAPLSAAGATLAATEGATFSATIATFTDANPNAAAGDFTAMIGWGDGQTSSGTVSADGNGGFKISGTHAYSDEGTKVAVVTISDVGGSAVTAISTVLVDDAPLAASGVTIDATEGIAFSGVVATFTDADPAGMSSQYEAQIAWGDGTTNVGTISAAGGGFQVSASHTYAEEGNYSLNVTITDAGGRTVMPLVSHTSSPESNGIISHSVATAASEAIVGDAPLTATAATVGTTEGAASNLVVATFTDADPAGTAGDYSATIDWGDGTTTTGTIAAGSTFEVNGSHAYNQGGTFSVKVTIADVGGSTATALSTVDVESVAISGSAVLINGFELTPLGNVPVATFVNGNGSAPAGSFQTTIDWGDGVTSTGNVVESGNTYTVTGSHNYLDEGTFTVSVRVSDAAASATVTTAARIREELLPDGTVGTPNQRYVQELYRDLLHRAPDMGGLNWWAGLLDKGVSRQQVALEIIASSMGNELGADMVTGIFEKFLGRDPDPSAMSFWITIISQRETIEDTEANVVGTPEFFYLAGSTDTGFITRLYRLALGRDPEQSAVDYFNTLMANGLTREKVAEIVLNSLEYRQDEISGYYQSPADLNARGIGGVPFIDDLDFLDRPADAAGLQMFSIEAEQGVLDQQIWGQMLGSDEFFAKIAG